MSKSRELNIALSIFNFPRADVARRSANWFVDQLQEVGADGIIWSDVPNVHPANIAGGGLGRRLARQGEILRLHQSWRGNRLSTLPALARQEAAKHSNKKTAAIAAGKVALQEGVLLTLPHLSTSLNKLQRVQDAAEKPLSTIVHPKPEAGLPVVVHPRDQHLANRPVRNMPDYHHYQRRFASLNWQITPELTQARGADNGNTASILQSVERLRREDGLDEPVTDWAHMVEERGGTQYDNPYDLTRALIDNGQFAWGQVGWQPNLSLYPQAVRKDLDFALDGRFHQSRQGRALIAAHEALPDGQMLNIDVEVAAPTMEELRVGSYMDHTKFLIDQMRETVS